MPLDGRLCGSSSKVREPEHGTASPSLDSASLFLDWHCCKHWVSP